MQLSLRAKQILDEDSALQENRTYLNIYQRGEIDVGSGKNASVSIEQIIEQVKQRAQSAQSGVLLQPQQLIPINYFQPQKLSFDIQRFLIFHSVGSGKTLTQLLCGLNYIAVGYKKIILLYQSKLVVNTWVNEMNSFGVDQGLVDFISFNQLAKKIKRILNAPLLSLDEIEWIFRLLPLPSDESESQRRLQKIANILTKSNNVGFDEQLSQLRFIIDKILLDFNQFFKDKVVFIDEAHNYFSTAVQTFLEVLISNPTIPVFYTTATPIKNSILDFFSLMYSLTQQKIDHTEYITYDITETKKKLIKNLKLRSQSEIQEFVKLVHGRVSYYKAADDIRNKYLYPLQEYEGVLFEGLIKPVVVCKLSKLQERVQQDIEDNSGLGVDIIASANCVVPLINPAAKEDSFLLGYGKVSVNKFLYQCQNEQMLSILNETLKKFFEQKGIELQAKNILDKRAVGEFFHEKCIRFFSSKFGEILRILRDIFEDAPAKRQSEGNVLIYSNFNIIGVRLVENLLLSNGFLAYQNSQDYLIREDTIDYRYGLTQKEYRRRGIKEPFRPATFIKLSGQSGDYRSFAQINKTMNSIENMEGKIIKVILGSKVINEAITIKNPSKIIILDETFNVNRTIQAIGRVIRLYNSIEKFEKNKEQPVVKIYKLVTFPHNFSTKTPQWDKLKTWANPKNEVSIIETQQEKLMNIIKLQQILKQASIQQFIRPCNRKLILFSLYSVSQMDIGYLMLFARQLIQNILSQRHYLNLKEILLLVEKHMSVILERQVSNFLVFKSLEDMVALQLMLPNSFEEEQMEGIEQARQKKYDKLVIRGDRIIRQFGAQKSVIVSLYPYYILVDLKKLLEKEGEILGIVRYMYREVYPKKDAQEVLAQKYKLWNLFLSTQTQPQRNLIYQTHIIV